jgi:PAS domain S-box-containing protein
MRFPKASSAPRLFGSVTLALGVAGFASWWSPIRALSGLPINGTHINPVTALAVALLGAGVLAGAGAAGAGDGRRSRLVIRACACALLAMAAARLGAAIGLWSFRVDALPVPGGPNPLADSEMAPMSAVASLLGGLGLLATPPRTERARALGQGLFLAVALVGATALIGHLYEATAFHGPMALVTAIGLVTAATGALFLDPEHAFIGFLRGRGAAGHLARRLLPMVILVPVLVSWLRLLGQRAGWFGLATGSALVAVSNIVIIAALVWLGLSQVDRAEAATRATQAALAESEERHRLLFEQGPLPAWVFDAETLAFLSVNQAAIEAYGYTRDEFTRMTIRDIRPVEDLPQLEKTLATLTPATPARSGMWRHRRADGTVIDVEVLSHVLTYGGRSAVLVLAQDVTERHRMEAALRASEERFRTLAMTANDGIVSGDADGRVTYFNPGAERMFGFAASEVLGHPITRLMPERFSAAHTLGLQRVVAGGEPRTIGRTVDLIGRRSEGREFPIEISLSMWQDADRPAFTAVIRDTTERVKAEEARRRYAAELESANAELDAFSYSVSHDLRAPLRAIDGFGQALLEDCGDSLDATARDHLLRIRNGTQRMGSLIDDLLELSRVTRSAMNRERVDLSALATLVADTLSAQAPARSVDWCIAPSVVADGDPRLLRVVLENLLGNAWKYTGKTARARIEFGAEGEDGTRRYYVRDNGAGFDMTYAGKLFTPFQRLHTTADFEGSGVGLATVARVIRRHGGRVWAEGSVGKGATVSFTL